MRRTPRHSPLRAASLCDARRGRPRQPGRFLIATGAGLPPQPRALGGGVPERRGSHRRGRRGERRRWVHLRVAARNSARQPPCGVAGGEAAWQREEETDEQAEHGGGQDRQRHGQRMRGEPEEVQGDQLLILDPKEGERGA